MESVKFIREKDGAFVDPVKYALQVMSEAHGSVKVYVGTDSQNFKRKTCYCTAICFHYDNESGSGRGVHVIYFKERVKKKTDHFLRLWDESQRSIEIAERLRRGGVAIERIDLDYNNDEYWYSNKLVAAGVGMVKGFGYNVAVKPEKLIATRAADHLIRK